jgi:hypothetical protein
MRARHRLCGTAVGTMGANPPRQMTQTGIRSLSPVLALACATVFVASSLPASAHASGDKKSARVTSPDGNDVAEVRPRAAGGDEVWVNDALVWPKDGEREATVTCAPRWSRTSHGIALLARENATIRLVVVLVHSDIAGEVLEWEVPTAALPAKVVMWIDANHVSVGEREMEPKLVASWGSGE